MKTKTQKIDKNCKNSYVFDKKRGPKTSTPVENIRQIHPFIPNKANVKIDKMNLSLILLKGYEDLRLIFGSIRAKNKANSKPIKPNNQSSIIDNHLDGKSNFPHFSLENDDFFKKQTQFKANSNPIKANWPIGPKLI
jgi:hypothetical protein